MEYASASYFPLLGINAIVGRTFAPEEDVTAGTHPVALISYMLWQRRFGGDPNVIGKTIELDKHPLTIIGVLPSGFKGQLGTADVWTPTMMAPTFFGIDLQNAPYANWLGTIIRLKPGVTQEQAQFALSTITANIEKTFPSLDGPAKLPQFRLKPLQEASLDPGIRRMFLILLGAVGFVMLIVCANLTNLTLGDVVTRRKEVAVRMALGASRGRIACQLLTESILMTSIGGALALLIANWGIDFLVKFRPGGETEFWTLYARTFDFFNIPIDGRVMAFNFLLALVAGILFGLIPAARLPRLNVNESLKNIGGRSAEEWRLPSAGMRNLLVVVEIALSVVLLIGAGLMMRSLTQLRSVNLGFVPQGVMVLRLGARKAKPEFFRSLLARTEALPGVELASVASGAPLMGKLPTTSLVPTGQQQNPDVKLPSVGFRNIAPNFFKTLGISFLKGRSFTEQDRSGTQRVAIINAAAATAYWPGQDPIGKRFELGLDSPYPNAGTSIEVIGVVDNAKFGKIEDAVGPDVYLPYLQPVIRPSLLIVRGNIAPAELITVVRRETRQLDRDAFVLDVKTMTERSAELTSRTRFIALLLSLFAGVAMLLATISVYVAMAYVVSTRTREIAIRMALGAQPNDVIKVMLGGGITLVSFGLLAGLLGAWAATLALKSQLYGVSATDPATFIGVAGLLIGVALLACWVPARRATKVDPLIALRHN
jgi:putative ABC transport system permease protein